MSKQETDIVALKAKGFAIFSIVVAHCKFVPTTAGENAQMCSRFLDLLGILGIGIFFYYAGLFFRKTQKGFCEFFRKKLKSILLPWIVCGTLVYLYITLRKGGMGFYSWCNWIIGNGTYLYFLSILSVLYLLLFFCRGRRSLLAAVMACSVGSIALTEFSSVLSGINPYLNPLNFAMWFTLGMLIDLEDGKIGELCRKTCWYTVAAAVAAAVFIAGYLKTGITYFQISYIPFELLGIWSIVGLSGRLKSRLLESLGEISFSIYLLHMPFAGMAVYLSNAKAAAVPFVLLRPVIVVGITAGLVYLIQYVCSKSRLLNKVPLIIGCRNK